MSDFWEALFLLNLLISFIIFLLSTSWKVNFEFFYFSFIAMILGWFLYFKITLKTGSLTFSELGVRFSYSGIFNFLLYLRRNYSEPQQFLGWIVINSPFSLRWILSLFIDLLDRRGLTIFQNFLLSVMSFSSKFPL